MTKKKRKVRFHPHAIERMHERGTNEKEVTSAKTENVFKEIWTKLDFMGHKRGAFPVAEQAADRVLSLPNYPEMTDDMVGEVAERLKEIMRW